MKRLLHLFIFVFIILESTLALSQDNNIYFSGRVASYKQNSFKISKKIKKSFEYQGGLTNAKLIVSDAKNKINITTNSEGDFKLEFNKQSIYNITVSKNGYSNLEFIVNLKNAPIEYFCDINNFIGTEFILIEGENNEKNFLGTFYYSTKKRNLTFEPSKNIDNQWLKNNEFLASKAVTNNYSSFKSLSSEKNTNELSENTNEENNFQETGTQKIISNLKKVEKLISSTNTLSLDEIHQYNELILSIKQDIAKQKASDKSNESSMMIANLEAELLFIESQLEKAREMNRLKDKEVELSKSINIIGLSLLILLLIFTIFILYHYLEKRKINTQLVEKNLQISNQNNRITNSLNYSSSIQKSIFKSKASLDKIFSQNFLFFKAKDIVSGDFYWFEKIDSKKIIIVGDCTGHGVPGALLTILGNTFLNDIIVTDQITSPKNIIKILNEKLVEIFNSDKDSIGFYGMDIAIVVFDEKSKTVQYSGAMNNIYQISSNQLIEHKASMISLGSPTNFKNDNEIQNIEVSYTEGDVFILFSDGYMDQFGGKNNEKLNKTRFEKLLLTASNKFENGESILSEYLTDWQGDKNQIDDVLVLGIKV